MLNFLRVHFYFMFYALACLLLAIVQLLLGTDSIFVSMAFASLLLAGSTLFYFGWYNITALFAFGLLSKYSVLPFFIKTIMGERIDVGLLAADKTFQIILVGSFVVLTALFVSNTFPIKKRLFNFNLSNKELQVFGYVAYGLGLGLTMLHVFMRPTLIEGDAVSGFGGFGGFAGLLYIGVICATAYLAKTDSKKMINKSLALMLAGSLIVSFLDNAKLYFTLSLFAYIATLFLFGRKLNVRAVISVLFWALIYTGIVVPSIQVLRGDIFQEAGMLQRMEIVIDYLENHMFAPQDVSSASALLFSYDYYPNLHTPVIDRLEMVQDLDVVLDGIGKSDMIGWKPIPMALVQITPHFLEPNKIPEIDVDFIAYQIGLTQQLSPIRRTLGIFGVSYAMFMWPGWIIVSFGLILIFFLLIRKLAPSSATSNIFGIYLLVKYGIYFSEMSVQNLIETMLRGIPMDIITIFILLKITRMIVRENRQETPLTMYRKNSGGKVK